MYASVLKDTKEMMPGLLCNCPNVQSENMNCFLFHKCRSLQAIWTNTSTNNHSADWISPSENFILCSKYFTKDCLKVHTKFGIKKWYKTDILVQKF